MFVLARYKCVREVSFDEFLRRLFLNNGLERTVFSFWPNSTCPNAVGVFYGYDDMFCKTIGLSGLCNQNFRLHQFYRDYAMPRKDVWIQEPVNMITGGPLADDFSPKLWNGRKHSYRVSKYFKVDDNVKMSIPMTPFFNKYRPIPDYIILPDVFYLDPQLPHALDEQKAKALHAARS